MDKPDKSYPNNHKKCYACGQESNGQCVFTEMAHYAAETGNLMMVARLACPRCREEILSVREYVREHGLAFGRNSQLFGEFIQNFLDDETSDQSMTEEEASLYQKYVDQQIKRNRLYHCRKLPQNCLQLVYYASYSVSHAQRHERIKNTISRVMREAPIPFGNIEDIAILVHYLTCYMHENLVVGLFKKISDRILLEGSPVTPAELDSELPTLRVWKCLYEHSYIGNIIVIIGNMLENWASFDENLRKIREQRQVLTKANLDQILNQSMPKIELPFNQFKKTSSELQPAQSEKNHKTQEGKYIKQEPSCQKCRKSKIIYLREIEKTKNYFSLVLRSLMKEDTAMRNHIEAMEQKHQKEKEEYINKIIRLKDKIQFMEGVQTNDIISRPRSASQSKIERIYKPDLESVSQKSQGTSRTLDYPNIIKNQENGKTSETQKLPEMKKFDMKIFHELIIHLPDFDPSLLSLQTSFEIITEALNSGMKTMKQNLEKFQKKNKALEIQSKRLLGILTRKQERFMPLIHEKDQLIEKYQNALWRMENHLPVIDEVLGPRIQTILNAFKNDVIENLSIGTVQEDMRSPNKAEMVEQSQLKPSPSKSTKKKKKKVAVAKKEERQCSLF